MRADVIPNTPTPAWDGRDLADLLELAPVAAGRFRSRFGERNENGRLYGGQLLGQAVMAAARTVPADRSATYLQFLFAAGGIPEQAVDYEVTALQDGKRFASRSVRGAQAGGRIVCDVGVSFARLIDAPSHGSAAPADSGIASDPAGLPGLKDIDAPEARDVERTLAYGYHDHPVIDLRLPFVDDVLRGDPAGPRVRFWVRVRPPLTTIRRCTPRRSPTSPTIGSTSPPASRMCVRRPRRAASSMSRASITRSGCMRRFAPTAGCCSIA